MAYKCLAYCIEDLEKNKLLLRITDEVDPNLELAEIHRQVFADGGPALLFTKVKGTNFPVVTNLFGTDKRCQFIFRNSWEKLAHVIQIKGNPRQAIEKPWLSIKSALHLLHALPRPVLSGLAPVLQNEIKISDLPQIKSWPMDGGPFITLPQVYSENPSHPGFTQSNLGMYRIQLSGNDYKQDEEIGLHYQLHRGLGIHHTKALELKKNLKVAIFVGGSPAHTLAAVMPLPEKIPELFFAGMLAGRAFRYIRRDGILISAEADFAIIGTIDPATLKPEGPFGDHLGYYALKHDFPVLKVEKVYHRQNAIWPATIVGRPPQEDSYFGKMIHQLTAPAVSSEIKGVSQLNAVDAAGVHPLLLAKGRESYEPYRKTKRPQELLTAAHAILGFGQCSLAKYLFIAAESDSRSVDINDPQQFFKFILERFDPCRDLHFHTMTTMDTLDYSGSGLGEGSKLVIAARGDAIRNLSLLCEKSDTNDFLFTKLFDYKIIQPGILLIAAQTKFTSYDKCAAEIKPLLQELESFTGPFAVLVDDLNFSAESFDNFLWVCFTRSSPAQDIYGVKSFVKHKHWGCKGTLLIDARIKPHHSPPVISDPEIKTKVKIRLKKLMGNK